MFFFQPTRPTANEDLVFVLGLVAPTRESERRSGVPTTGGVRGRTDSRVATGPVASPFRSQLYFFYFSKARQQLGESFAGPHCHDREAIRMEMFLGRPEHILLLERNHARAQLLEKILGQSVIFQLDEPADDGRRAGKRKHERIDI